jgi:phage/plasmid-like protein (TIGR03299 family)
MAIGSVYGWLPPPETSEARGESTMPANVETMAYVGEMPWHKQGRPVPPHISAAQMIQAAGLDWEVEKRPARGYPPIKKRGKPETFARYEIVRLPRPGTQEQETVLGMVTNRYEPLQNVDAFSFFDPIVDQKTATFETAGALGAGERVWVLAKMPEEIQVFRGDDCEKYLLLSNTHSGQSSVTVKFTAVRVVCQNTLILSLKDGQQAFRVRHSRKMSDRLSEVGKLVAAVKTAYAEAAQAFARLAKAKIESEAMLDGYLAALFPPSDAQKRNRTPPPKWMHVKQLMKETPDLQMPGVRGTAWGAYNAVTRFEDYRQARDETPAKRLERVWFGSGADLKVKALNEALRLAG